jgi:hypothetical protein
LFDLSLARSCFDMTSSVCGVPLTGARVPDHPEWMVKMIRFDPSPDGGPIHRPTVISTAIRM